MDTSFSWFSEHHVYKKKLSNSTTTLGVPHTHMYYYDSGKSFITCDCHVTTIPVCHSNLCIFEILSESIERGLHFKLCSVIHSLLFEDII